MRCFRGTSRSIFHILIRGISLCALGGLLAFTYKVVVMSLLRAGLYIAAVPAIPTFAALLVSRFEKRAPSPVMWAVLCAIPFYITYRVYEQGLIRQLTTGDVYDFFLALAVFAVIEAVLRWIVRIKDPDARWYMLHAIGNGLVVYYSYETMLSVFLDPASALDGSHLDDVGLGHAFAMALHAWHCIAYKITVMDFFHHAISVLFVGILAYCVRWTRVVPMCNIFMSGLPGGVDYFLLSLEKMGYITRLTEKRINKWLNVSIRWPGIVISIFCIMVSAYHRDGGQVPLEMILLGCFFDGGNALYFAQRVVGNTAVTEYKLREAKKKNPKKEE